MDTSKALNITALLLLAFAQNAEIDASAQNYAMPNNARGIPTFQSYSSGFSGRQNNNSFNGGFSGLNPQVQPSPGYNTPRQATQSTPNTMNSLEQMLDNADSNWSQTPVNGIPNSMSSANMPARQSSSPMPQTRTTRQNWKPGGTANRMSGMFPQVSRQEMLRVFMEGGSPQMGAAGSKDNAGYNQSKANSSANASTAYSNYQLARNEQSKARNEANNARSGHDQWNRKSAASRAEYAANNANYAAQRAESAAYSGDAQARNYANLARQAANYARDSANKARYNADTIR